MDAPKTTLFQKRASAVDLAKGGIMNLLKKYGPVAAGSVGTAAAMDHLQNHGDYSNIGSDRILNAGLNALIGGVGGHLIGGGLPGGIMSGSSEIMLAPAKDALLGVPAMQKDLHNFTQNAANGGFSPLQKNLMIGGGALGLGAALPALLNISSAAKRIGSGHAVRVSTSVRHNKQYNDDPTDSSAISPDAIPVPEEKPSILSRLLHW